MPRTPANELHHRVLPGGRVFLFGRILGTKIRRRYRSEAAMLTAKAELELRVLKHANALAGAPGLKLTRLSHDQLRDAEAAVEMSRGRRLVECVAAAQRILPPIDAITCEFALTEWLAILGKRKRSARTVVKNEARVQAFLDVTKAANLVDVTPMAIERHVLRSGCADFTRLTDGQVLRAWLNFCTKRRWLAITPFEIDMKDLSATARPKEPGRILTPQQCASLLAAASSYAAGRLLPYAILTTWCFMRDSEVQRTTRAAMKLDAKIPIVVVDPTKRRTVRHREVTIPANVLPLLKAAVTDWPVEQLVPFSRVQWAAVRELAGLLKRGKVDRNKRRPLLESVWQSDITRHSGISYLYQRSGDIRDVCRQAGNKSEVSFRHYLTLPEEGAADRFYGAA